jgi:dihydrofolate synthase/folylpolyglutamate synthase
MNLEAWLLLLEKRHPQAIDMGLERCGLVYRQLGSPRPAKLVFTVAGTNGKGSTVAFLSAMSGALGQRYGSFTSPHIFRFNERISIMGEAVSDACLVRAFEQVEAARGDISLTYFEFTTLAGFLILNQSGLDSAVLEVGLGGRLDSVNLVDTDCAIITAIGLDHQEYLGPDLSSIATEKAGIFRPGKPVVCAEANPPAPILELAANLRAPLYRRDIDFEISSDSGLDLQPMLFSIGDLHLPVARPSMGGKHQLDNLAAALAALVLLNPGCETSISEISAAIRNCSVPGRLQRVFSSPEIILDVGHNELAAEVVAAYFRQKNNSAVTCVLAMLADKSAEAVALALGGVCRRWLCAGSFGERGQSGQVLARRIETELPSAEVRSFEALDEAMQEALSSTDADETILVFGSFSTVLAAADWLQNSMQQDSHDAAKINGIQLDPLPGKK